MQRRQFLTTAAASAAASLSPRLYAMPSDDGRKYLFIFLRGGYDALSLLVPISSSQYYDSRPHIAIPPQAALPLTPHWGLHPAVHDTLYPMAQSGELDFVPFVGIPHVSRSHFDAQERWELGLDGLSPKHPSQPGVLAQFAQRQAQARPIAFTTNLPVAFRGGGLVPNVALRSGLGARGNAALQEQLLALYAQHPLAEPLQVGLGVQRMAQAAPQAAQHHQATQEAHRVGHLLKAGFNIGFMDMGGWDTHFNQGHTEGPLANRLQALGATLVALKAALGADWARTTVVVASEFGRTLKENGSKGTDHGHATTYLLANAASALPNYQQMALTTALTDPKGSATIAQITAREVIDNL